MSEANFYEKSGKRILHANVNVMSHIYWFKSKVQATHSRDWLNAAAAAATT